MSRKRDAFGTGETSEAQADVLWEEETRSISVLRERIRELEAALEQTGQWGKTVKALIARAEKAERSEEQYRIAYEQQTENVKTLGSRVAELEDKLAYELIKVSGLTETEARRVIRAREREAD